MSDSGTNKTLEWVRDLLDKPSVRRAEHAVALAAIAYGTYAIAFSGGGLKANLTRGALSLVKAMPGGAALVAAEQQKVLDKINEFVRKEDSKDKVPIRRTLPKQGLGIDEMLEILRYWRSLEKTYREGKSFGGIYKDGHDHDRVINEAFAIYSDSNGLYPNIFPSLRRMEAELVRMTANLLNGGDNVCGTMTSGGTESIIMSVKAHRVYFGQKKGITEPEMIVSQSQHGAFHKASQYLGVKIHIVPLTSDYRADLKAFERLVNRNTIMICVSAPCYPHGVIDDIAGASKLALKHDIGLHVDTCLGGFLLPFLQKLGHLPKDLEFDFRLPGVTAMSADIHKYGYGPKGNSIILYSKPEIRRCQYHVYTEWSGGIFCSPSAAGSRAGGQIAASYASVMTFGEDNYLKLANKVQERFLRLVKAVNEIDGIETVGKPQTASVAIMSKEMDVFKIGDAMGRDGWELARLQKPECIMQQVSAREDFDEAGWIESLKKAVADVRRDPSQFADGLAPIYGMAANMPDRGEIESLLRGYVDALYNL